jgi:hypothetical protein
MKLRKLLIQVAGLILMMGVACEGHPGKSAVAVESGSGSDKKSAQGALPSCWDPMPPTSGQGGQPNPSHHSVTLSWKASAPVSKLPRDVVKGYYVYRSRTSQKHTLRDQMNAQPISETGCVDRSVEPSTTYFYSVRALSQGGAQSIFSREVKAVVPFP